jgi:hypothetical protein
MLYIDDRLPRHPKIFRAGSLLGDNGPAQALALYLDGLSYARSQLTDGFVPDTFVTSSCVVQEPLRVAFVLSSRGVRLWKRVRGGYLIHDYFDLNPTALEVKEKRAKEREKKRRQRHPNGNGTGACPPGTPRAPVPDVPVPGTSTTDQVPVPRSSQIAHGLPSAFAAADPALQARAEQLLARYTELYAVHRHGARYHNTRDRDLEEAVGLAAAFDDARLEVLMVAFLTTDDAFCRNGNGTMAQFRSRASWCDSKLREAGL